MNLRRGLFAVLIASLTGSVALFAQQKKQTDAQKKEIQGIVKIVDGLTTGQPAPNDLGLTWVREDVLKAQGNKEYVPFTVSIDPSKVSGNVALYWRVVSKDGAAPAATATTGKDDKKKDDKKEGAAPPKYAYEDVVFLPVTAGTTPLKISRSFTVSAGSYDVFVVAKEATPEKPAKNAPPQKMAVLKQTVSVPDFWNGELAT